MYLRSAGEPPKVSDMTLSKYLKVMNEKPKHMIFDKLETLYNFHSHKERFRFLCDLTETPMSSAVENEERLLKEVKNWLNFH
jgi:hypothetical protein